MFSAFKKIISPSKTSEESVALESSEQGLGKSGPSRSRAGRREARHAETPYSAKGSNRRQSFFSGIVQKLNPFSPSPSSTPARVASDNDDENDEMVETVEPIVREQPAQKTLGAGSKKLKMTLIEESSDFLKTDTFAAADAEFQALVQTFQPPIQPFTEPLPKEPVSLSSSASFTFNNPLGKTEPKKVEARRPRVSRKIRISRKPLVYHGSGYGAATISEKKSAQNLVQQKVAGKRVKLELAEVVAERQSQPQSVKSITPPQKEKTEAFGFEEKKEPSAAARAILDAFEMTATPKKMVRPPVNPYNDEPALALKIEETTCKGQEELLKESVEVIKKSVALNTSFPSLLPKTPAPSTPAKKETSAFITPVKPKENAFLQAISSISKSKPEEIIPVPIVEPPKEVKKAPSFQMPAPKIKEQKPVEAPIAPVFGFDMKQQVKQQVPVLQTIPTPVKPSSPPLTEKTKTAKDVLDQVAKFPDFQLPKVTFKSPPPSQLSSHTSLQSVKSLKEFDLPIFNFGSASYSQNGDAEKLPNGHSLLTRLGPASTPPSIEVPKTSLSSKPALAGWTCNICLVNNSDDAVKCVACESDKPEAKKVQNTAKPVFEMPKSTTTSSQSFNWPSSGSNFKPITNSGWSCPVCMISNKMDAMKCAACEAGKPGSSSVNTIKPVTTTSKNGFSFAAPTGWSCSVCLVNNKSDANKCIACETDKPGHKSSSDTVKEAPKMPVPPSLTSGGFSFGAFAAPAGWSCSVCLVNNKSDANKCIACETDKPGTKSSSASGSQPQFSMPAPPAAATSFSFGSSISNFGTPSGTTSEGKKDEDSNSGFSFGFGSQSSSLPSTGFSFGGQ